MYAIRSYYALKVRDATGGEFVERVGVTGTEIEELDRHVHVLIDRINAAMADLEKNRKLLARSEKLASLGKVAASVVITSYSIHYTKLYEILSISFCRAPLLPPYSSTSVFV